MSIQQVSNNRPSGSSALSCDAGIPIVGRTSSTGTYEILKVNADGTLAGATVSPSTVVPYSVAPTAYPLAPVAAKAAGIILYYDSVTTSALTDGLYKITPFYMLDTLTAAPSVSIVLVRAGSTLDAYCNTRSVGADGFTPNPTDFASGYACFWDNNPLQTLSSTNMKSTAMLTTQTKEVYLKAASYKLLVFVHTAVTPQSSTSYVGFSQFTKIS